MNRDSISKILIDIEAIDIWSVFKEVYPNSDLSTLTIEDWSLASLDSNLKRLIIQFRNKMNEDEFEYLPNNYLMYEFNSSTSYVTTYLSSIIQNLVNRNLPEVIHSIKWLISYQVAYGFWKKSETKIHDPKTIDLQKKASEIGLLQSKLEFEISKVQTLENTLANLTKEIEVFYKQKQDELKLISNSHQDVINKNNEVSNVLIQINDLKSQANTTLNSISDIKSKSVKFSADSEAYIKIISDKIESFSDELEKNISGQEIRIKSIDENYLEIKKKKDFIDLKELDIIKLASKASDGALGHTFNTRETKLGKSARLWMYATGAMIIILFTWIFIVFACLGTSYTPEWTNPLFSTLKIVPAFLILVFIAKQYTKERNLEEEYAFKSAIAMTLTAYADEIAKETDEDRRILIKETIEKIYKSPKITSESVGLFNIREKQIEAISEKLADNLSKLVDKGIK